MKILPDYEHMEYRDVYTCRTYPHPALWLLPLHGRSREVLSPGLSHVLWLRLAVVGLGAECTGWVSAAASSVLGSTSWNISPIFF